jgi:hypothetical protein
VILSIIFLLFAGHLLGQGAGFLGSSARWIAPKFAAISN